MARQTTDPDPTWPGTTPPRTWRGQRIAGMVVRAEKIGYYSPGRQHLTRGAVFHLAGAEGDAELLDSGAVIPCEAELKAEAERLRKADEEARQRRQKEYELSAANPSRWNRAMRLAGDLKRNAAARAPRSAQAKRSDEKLAAEYAEARARQQAEDEAVRELAKEVWGAEVPADE